MFVKYENKNYMVKFAHTPFVKQNKRRSTTCTIFELRPGAIADKEINFDGEKVAAVEIVSGTSTTSNIDAQQFSKAFGRTMSLQRALRKLIQKGYFNDGNKAWKCFITELNTQHPNGMVEASKLLNDSYYTDPHIWY